MLEDVRSDVVMAMVAMITRLIQADIGEIKPLIAIKVRRKSSWCSFRDTVEKYAQDSKRDGEVGGVWLAELFITVPRNLSKINK